MSTLVRSVKDLSKRATKEPRARRMLGVRATEEEQRVIATAAAREHRSLSNFVLRAALESAKSVAPKPKKSREEVLAIFKAVRDEYQALNPGRDPLAELLAERRAEANGE